MAFAVLLILGARSGRDPTVTGTATMEEASHGLGVTLYPTPLHKRPAPTHRLQFGFVSSHLMRRSLDGV